MKKYDLQQLGKLIDSFGIIELRMRMQKNETNPLLTFEFSIVHDDIKIMEWLLDTCGGHFFLKHDQNFKFCWYVNRKTGAKILIEAWPFLQQTQKQAKIYLECARHIDSKTGLIKNKDGWTLTPEEWAYRLRAWETIVKENIPRRNNKMQTQFTFFVGQIKRRYTCPLLKLESIQQEKNAEFTTDEWHSVATLLHYGANLSLLDMSRVVNISRFTLKTKMLEEWNVNIRPAKTTGIPFIDTKQWEK